MNRFLLSGLLVLFLAPPTLAQPLATEGVVDQVQLLDASALARERFLILTLTDGRHYLLPDATQLPAASGVLVAVDYLQPATDEALPEACRVQVLGMPIMLDGEEVMQRAGRPFEVYRNPDPDCSP